MATLPRSNQPLVFVILALVALGCSDGPTSSDDGGGEPRDASPGADAGSLDAGGGGLDAGDSADASTGVDSGAVDAGSGDPDAGEPTCAELPACEAAKGCGPTLTEPCCCEDSVFIPQPGMDCCCGYGFAPGADLMCSGAGEG